MKMPRQRNIEEKEIGRERVFDGLILHIDHVKTLLPDGHVAPREVARHIGASAILPLDDAGNVTLVRQYRMAVGRVLTEIPAGKLDRPDEDRLEAAKRELREETGLSAGKWTHLADIATTPGFSSEIISLYLARELSQGETDPDEDEFLNLLRMPLGDAVNMAARGEIEDAKTVCALLMARALLDGGEK